MANRVIVIQLSVPSKTCAQIYVQTVMKCHRTERLEEFAPHSHLRSESVLTENEKTNRHDGHRASLRHSC